MPYLTGSAASLTDLLGALQDGCVANGWTLTNGILSKGGCVTQLSAVGKDLQVLGGTGLDAKQALVAPGPQIARIGANAPPVALAFPLVYHLHIQSLPDEVYLFVNHSVNAWQWLAFGCSPAPGVSGTGGWYAATGSPGGNTTSLYISSGQAGGYGSGAAVSGALFGQSGAWINGYCVSSYVHHGLDGGGWSVPDGFAMGSVGAVDAWNTVYPLLGRQPNAWNGESALLPIQVIARRPSAKVSLVGQIAHARYVRNDNLADGEVITLGHERWKSYPWARKDTSVRDGGYAVAHSGTFGVAIRYDGP